MRTPLTETQIKEYAQDLLNYLRNGEGSLSVWFLQKGVLRGYPFLEGEEALITRKALEYFHNQIKTNQS